MADLAKIVGDNIRQLLWKKRLKQTDLARATGIGEGYVSKICTGQHMPGTILPTIAEALEVEPWQLLKEGEFE